MDPDADSLQSHSRAWLIGPGERFESMDEQGVEFVKYYDNGMLFQGVPFKDGQSGSPVFSERGHLVGMAISRESATRFSLILTRLEKDWKVPTNLAGPYSKLWFRERYKGAAISVAGRPEEPLTLPHPAPLGDVPLALRIGDDQELKDVINVTGNEMVCNVTQARWVALHKHPELYTALGLMAASGIAFGLAKISQHSFEQSPSRAAYDNVGLFNAIAIGTGVGALAVFGVTVAGYLSSDTTAISCRAGTR